MKRPVIAVLATALSFGSLVFAQQQPSKSYGDPKKVTASDSTGQMKTTEGVVKEFEAGKKLVLTTIDNKTMTFKLDQKNTTANVDPAVAVGANVKVTEQKSGDGTKSLTVEPASKTSTSSQLEPGAKS